MIKAGFDTPFPSYIELKAEADQNKEELVFTIKDSSGKVVKKEFRAARKGVQRFHWNLRYTTQGPINLSKSSLYNPFPGSDEGTLVNPGMYTVEMALLKDGQLNSLTTPVTFEVKALNNVEMPAENRAEKVAFQKDLAKLQADMAIARNLWSDANNKMRYIKAAIKRAEQPIGSIMTEVMAIEKELEKVQLVMYGDPIKRRLDIAQPLSPASRLGSIGYEQKYSTATPTKTHRDNYAIAKDEIYIIKTKMEGIYNDDIKALEKKLIESGAPYTPGRGAEHRN